ncbi:hypothetical protein ACHQM5_027084 [Ranunculus cassubicifolius]
MAEDEDDDMFGDFKFISSSNSNSNSNSNQSKNDDDWGDFVATISPKQDLFQSSNGFSTTQNTSNTAIEFSQNFNSNSNTPDHNESKLSSVESSKKLGWEKPKGALPLSIFGFEEEDESDKDEAPQQESFSAKTVSNGGKSGSGVSFNDLIGNLYGQDGSKLNLKTENGFSNGVGEVIKVEEFEEDDWEFKDAVPVNSDFDVKKDENVFDSWLIQTEKPISPVQSVTTATKTNTTSTLQPTSTHTPKSQVQETSEGSLFGFSNNAQVGSDWFTASKGSSYNPNVVENGFHFAPGVTTANTWSPNSLSTSTPVVTANANTTYLVSGSNESDDLFGDFEVASQKREGSSYNSNVIDDGFYFEKEVSTADRLDQNSSPSTTVATANGNKTYLVNGSNGSDDSFGDFEDASQKIEGTSYNSNVIDNGFHSESGVSTANFWNSTSSREPIPITNENGNTTCLVNGSKDSDEIFGNFEDASQKPEASNSASEHKGKDKPPEIVRGALPLSIFGDDKLESDESLYSQEMFSSESATPAKKGINKQVSISHLSLNDLISDLYGQAENVSTVRSISEHSENGLSPTKGSSSNLASVEDDFDDSSWEFKVASSEIKAEHPIPVVGTLQELPTESKIVSFVEFYSRLKEDSGFIIVRHLGGLKDAQKLAALSGDDSKAEALHEEIQIASEKLSQENIVSTDVLEEHAPRSMCLNELLEALKEPKFQVLEQEYHLSQKLSLAEKNLESAIELFEHAISVLKILSLGSKDELFTYTSSWSRMISACVQELKHGASIWTQSLQKNVHAQIVSKSQGQQYIISLGEIYRVAEILRISAIFYKPWILSSLVNPMDIFTSLEECRSLWSTSSLDEALQSLSNSVDIAKKLGESIKSILHLDITALTPQKNNTLPEEICRLSLSTSKLVPEMKMVSWNGEQYFVTVANFWANLVSSEPPNLPSIPVNT